MKSRKAVLFSFLLFERLKRRKRLLITVVTNRVFERSKFQFMYLLSLVMVQLILFLSFSAPSKQRLIQ